jgi:hypothetical protein
MKSLASYMNTLNYLGRITELSKLYNCEKQSSFENELESAGMRQEQQISKENNNNSSGLDHDSNGVDFPIDKQQVYLEVSQTANRWYKQQNQKPMDIKLSYGKYDGSVAAVTSVSLGALTRVNQASL